ncbi:MAG: hypothetical protein H0W49_08060 [Nitrospirales bacterium]|nr:hypothetical protein [Nitrospirales bacterium]
MAKKPSIQESGHDTPKKSSSAGKLKGWLIKKASRREAMSGTEECLPSGGTGSVNSQPTNGNVQARMIQRG